MEQSRFSFVDITMPKNSYDELNSSMALHAGDLNQLWHDYPREAYAKVVFGAMVSLDNDVVIKVDDKAINRRGSWADQKNIVGMNQRQDLPDIDITPVQVRVAVWKRPNPREIMERCSFKQFGKTVLNFYVLPPDFAY